MRRVIEIRQERAKPKLSSIMSDYMKAKKKCQAKGGITEESWDQDDTQKEMLRRRIKALYDRDSHQ